MAHVTFESLPPGYSKLASLISKDRDYAVFRKFTSLNARNLLYLQAEVTYLEKRLQEHDVSLNALEDGNSILSSWPKFVEDGERKRLVEDMRRLLGEYNSALVLHNQVLSMNDPTQLQLEGLRVWSQDRNPISDISQTYFLGREIKGDLREKQFKNRKRSTDLESGCNDLASLNALDQSWLSRLLRRSFLRWIFTNDYIYLSDKTSVLFFPARQIDRIATGVAILFCVLVTVLAIALLQHQTKDSVRIPLIGVFATLVAIIIALSGAKKSEVLIGTVGFMAVIVVFISTPDSSPLPAGSAGIAA